MLGVDGVRRIRPPHRVVLDGTKLSLCPKVEEVEAISELKVPFSLVKKDGIVRA